MSTGSRQLVWGAMLCVGLLLSAATLWLVFSALDQVRMVSVAVVVALLLAALLDRPVALLVRLRLPRWLASLTSVLVLVLAIIAALSLVVNRALAQLADLQNAVSSVVGHTRYYLLKPPLSLPSAQISQAQDALLQGISHVTPSPIDGTAFLLQFSTGVVLMLFVLFFLTKDGRVIWAWVLSWTPTRDRRRLDEAGHRAWHTLTSYVHGTVAIAFIDATGIGVAMLILRVPLTVSLTLITFLGAFVPIVGATVAGVLAVMVTLVTLGPIQAVILLGAVVIVQQVEGNVLLPLIMGRALQLHPLVIVLSVTVGGLLGGVAGAVVAVPLVAVFYRVTSYLSGRD